MKTLPEKAVSTYLAVCGSSPEYRFAWYGPDNLPLLAGRPAGIWIVHARKASDCFRKAYTS